jgi:choloylglycine hydrolase
MGLVIGMAAVPGSGPNLDDSRPTLGSLGMIRVLLDHTATVEEAVALMQKYNLDFSGGPKIHYLIADAQGQSALVEYYQDEMYITYNQSAWHQATNFTLATVADNPEDRCWRYDAIHERLDETQGRLEIDQALQLLQAVSEDHTQWSIVYNSSSGDIRVVMGKAFESVEEFHLNMAPRQK